VAHELSGWLAVAQLSAPHERLLCAALAALAPAHAPSPAQRSGREEARLLLRCPASGRLLSPARLLWRPRRALGGGEGPPPPRSALLFVHASARAALWAAAAPLCAALGVAVVLRGDLARLELGGGGAGEAAARLLCADAAALPAAAAAAAALRAPAPRARAGAAEARAEAAEARGLWEGEEAVAGGSDWLDVLAVRRAPAPAGRAWAGGLSLIAPRRALRPLWAALMRGPRTRAAGLAEWRLLAAAADARARAGCNAIVE